MEALSELIKQGAIRLKYNDSIPKSLLYKADKDKELSGYVYPNKDISRAGIYLDNKLVGFMTPRKEPGNKGWRTGAIYVDKNKAGKGIGREAIKKFFKSRKAAPVPIAVDNVASQKAFSAAGFKDTKKEFRDGDWLATFWEKK